MLASGFAGLGYQIVWTEQCSLWLGHESAAVLAVVAAFFGGLALGGLALGDQIERSARPRRWYVGCELVISGWSLLLLQTSSACGGWLLRLIGVAPSAAWHWGVAFAACFMVFLPATAAMGATLPAMERLTPQRSAQGRSLASLYAMNTLGAVLGVLAAAFVLIPEFGLARTGLVCVALNVACAGLALSTFPRVTLPAGNPRVHTRTGARAPLGRLALSGLLGIGYEVVVVRVLSQLTENTVYTFALLLAVYLIGTAAGAAIHQRWAFKTEGNESLRDRLFAVVAAACLVCTQILYASEALRTWLTAAFGEGMSSAIAAEGLLALLTFGPVTIAMGALFSQLTREASALGSSFGRALGVNTLAAAAAPGLFGVLLLPAFGAKVSLLLLALGYLSQVGRRSWSRWRVRLLALATGALALLAPRLTFVDVPEGGRVLSYQEGAMAAVSVVQDATGVLSLRINNRQQEGSSATRRVDARQAWLPLLLHPAPRQALFLGLGTGVTSSAATGDRHLQVDVVELLPEVIAASTRFTAEARRDDRGERFHVMVGDARRYVRTTARKYDLVVSDNFHPARSGSGALYTVEHFSAVRSRLADQGLFCQWLPLHQLDMGTLRSIVRSFISIYPGGFAMLASNSLETPVLGLIGHRDAERIERGPLRDRLASTVAPATLAELGFDDEFSVLGAVIAGPSALAHFAGSAPLNTDDRPIVAYAAPRITYAPDSLPRDRLIALLHELSCEPSELLAPPADPEFFARLSAYWAARDRFVELGRDVRPSARVEDMLAQVRQPLLSVLRISPEFRPAYDPLLAMSDALARTDTAAARALLGELSRLQPARVEAPRRLAQLDSTNTAPPSTRH